MNWARDSILSIAGICVIGITGFLSYERFGVEDGYVETYCNINLVRGGNCRFTVEQMTSGRTCVEVSLTNKYNDDLKDSVTVCSGLVGPMETKNIAYILDVNKACRNDFDNCEFDVQ